MKRASKIVFGVLFGLAAILFGAFQFLMYQTKQASPLEELSYENEGVHISVDYSRPSMKGRIIFGGLVPYGEVWRAGANEPTHFKTETDILLNDKLLPSGEYTLWIIPFENEWEVIFNSKDYGWGIDWETGEAARNPDYDEVKLTLPVLQVDPVQKFTIAVQSNLMSLSWEESKVEIFINPVYSNPANNQ